MKSSEIDAVIAANCANFIDICPHCGTKAHLELVHNEHHIAKKGNQYNYVTFRCVPCRQLSVQVYRSIQNPYSSEQNLTLDEWVAKFPSSDTTPSEKFNEHVPAEVLSDYAEGLICLSTGADRASVSMFRRAMQNAMINLGADQELDLINQIKSVPTLTKDIKDWAHNVRIFGNWGAHPQDDMLKDVTPELAQEVKELLEEFMNYVYVMPGKVAATRAKYIQKNSGEPKKQAGNV
jgi:hypothetical protein